MSVPYSPEIVERIQKMHASGLVEVQWLTDWSPSETAEWARVGLDFQRAPQPKQPYEGWWKAAVISEWLHDHPDDLLVWADDQLSRRAEDVDLSEHAGRVLMITPRSDLGLTHAHLDRIEAWLRQANPC